MMIFFKFRGIIFRQGVDIYMKVLVAQVSWNDFYRGNQSEHKDSTNFINLNGFYFGYFNGQGLAFENGKEKISIDYLIFVSNHPSKGSVIVGWYKNPTVFTTCQTHHKGNLYYSICKDEDGVLLDIKDRDFVLNCEGDFEWITLNKRLKIYLEKTTKRVNYRQSDVNKAVNVKFTDLKNACEMIEAAIMHEHYLQALQLTNRAIMLYEQKVSLTYYKAWVLYLLLQYHHAVQLLSQILNVEAYSDLVSYMLGNIFFETEDYEKSILFLRKVKHANIDMTNYMLSQAYAMQGQVALARGAIEKAIIANPSEQVYQDFRTSLKEWNHE